MVHIREASSEDFAAIWEIFVPVVSAGDSYPFSPDISQEQAKRAWMDVPYVTYVALLDERIVGTYYLKANQPALGAHVCNCGYMVSPGARGKGVATNMCSHSQQEAVQLGYCAMQFNLVVSTNEGAVRLWKKLGFEVVGTLPKAFNHKEKGFVDAYVMYKWLE